MEALEHYSREPDIEIWQKIELKSVEQPSTSDFFSLNSAMLEAWALYLGFSATQDNRFPVKPVWVRFSATHNEKSPTHFL